jgi:hypothetical protein
MGAFTRAAYCNTNDLFRKRHARDVLVRVRSEDARQIQLQRTLRQATAHSRIDRGAAIACQVRSLIQRSLRIHQFSRPRNGRRLAGFKPVTGNLRHCR